MNSEDFSDGSDESDLDYKPPGEEEVLSEIDSDDKIDDDYNGDGANTTAVRSKKNLKQIKRKRGSQKNDVEMIEKTKDKEDTLPKSSEEDKKRLDALWEEFQRPVPKKSISNTSNTSESKSKLKVSTIISDKPETTRKRNFEELFDSSDSPKKVAKNDDNTTELKCPEPKSIITSTVKKSPGGLANVLNQIGKKNKLTVLEKSKQDWDGYKKKEGIVEELITYNKGKDGFLEKRDFLERTDLRQFELEKSMRAANRSRRNQ